MLVTEAALTAKIAQLCQFVGYSSLNQDSLNVLVDLYGRIIMKLAQHTKDASLHNERTESTYVDLVQAFDYLHISIPALEDYIRATSDSIVELKIPPHETKPCNRIQRHLHPDELLEAKKNVSLDNNDQQTDKDAGDKEEQERLANNNPLPELLKTSYMQISKNFPSNLVTAINRIRPPSPVTIKIKPIRPKTLAERKEIPSAAVAQSSSDQALVEHPDELAIPSTSKDAAPSADDKKEGKKQKGSKIKKTKGSKARQLALKVQPKSKSKSLKGTKETTESKAVAKSARSNKKEKLKLKNKEKSGKKKAPVIKLPVVEPPAMKAEPPQPPKVKQQPAPTPEPAPVVVHKPVVVPETIKVKHEAPIEPKEASSAKKSKAKDKTPKEKSKTKDRKSKFTIVTQTVGQESTANEWLCPACHNPDDGDLMIGCDKCDEWYHLRCTGLSQPPGDDDTWECKACAKPAKKQRNSGGSTSSRVAVKAEKPSPAPSPARRSTSITPLPPQARLTITPTPAERRSALATENYAENDYDDDDRSNKNDNDDVGRFVKDNNQVDSPDEEFSDEQAESAPVIKTHVGADGEDLCPECNLPDDGTMMIQCDDPFCAKWFHGKCVNLLEEPKEDESWFCKACVEKQQSAFSRRRRAK